LLVDCCLKLLYRVSEIFKVERQLKFVKKILGKSCWLIFCLKLLCRASENL